MKNYIFASIGIFSSILGLAQKDLNIKYKLRAQIYASSAIEDTSAFGGFGGSSNIPKFITENFREDGFFLKIDTLKTTVIDRKHNGYKLFIVNKTDSIVRLPASDSRLSVVAQAYIDNKWQDIEYLPSSWCGNSYHIVSIMPNQYWEFEIPKFVGKINTRLRYQIYLGKEKKYLYSNEILASINKKQLQVKQGHEPQGLMDPYND